MKIHRDENGDLWLATRCDYRHRGKYKKRYRLVACYRSGAAVLPETVKYVSSL